MSREEEEPIKTIVYRGPRDFVIEDKPEPRPGPLEVLVHPLFVGLCFADKHWYEGPRAPGGMVGGHEFSAEIVALGSEVEGLRPGQIVSVDPRIYCGNCLSCRAGLETMCGEWKSVGVSAGHDGGLADLCVVPSYACYLLPEGVTPEAAACADPMACATRAVRHSGVRIGDNVALLGGEDYMLFAARWLRSAGVNRVVLIDPVEVRRTAALAMGAHEVLNPGEVDVIAVARESMPIGADVVFVSCEDYMEESALYLAQAFDICRRQGTVVVLRLGYSNSWERVTPLVPWVKEITVRHFGNFFGNEPMQGGRERGDWQLTLDAMGDGRAYAPPMGANIVDFDDVRTKADVDEIFEMLPSQHVKTLIAIG